jgi:hypothetical protein
MPGGSLNLSGATSVQVGAGVQLARHPNGDITVAARPSVASAPTKPTSVTNNGPPGVTATDTLKDLGKTAGNGLATVAVGPVAVVGGVGLAVGGALVGLAEGHPINTTKEVRRNLVGHVESHRLGWRLVLSPFIQVLYGRRSPAALFLLAQFRCLPEIFRVLDKCVSIGHARDVIGNLTYAL